jgi:hypothetical protein
MSQSRLIPTLIRGKVTGAAAAATAREAAMVRATVAAMAARRQDARLLRLR